MKRDNLSLLAKEKIKDKCTDIWQWYFSVGHVVHNRIILVPYGTGDLHLGLHVCPKALLLCMDDGITKDKVLTKC